MNNLFNTQELLREAAQLINQNNEIIIMPLPLFDLEFLVEETNYLQQHKIEIDKEYKKINLLKKINKLYLHIINCPSDMEFITNQKNISKITKNSHHNHAFLELFCKSGILTLTQKGTPEHGKTNSKYDISELYLFNQMRYKELTTKKTKLELIYNDVQLKKIYDKNKNKFIDTLKNTKVEINDIIQQFIDKTINENVERKELSRLINNLNINNYRRITKFSKNDRIFNSLCSLSSEIRDIITYKDEKFHSLDLRSAQPTLLLLTIFKLNADKRLYLQLPELKDELEKYTELINSGQFYEFFKPDDMILRTIKYINGQPIPTNYQLSENTKAPNYWRDEIKVELYRGVMFDWNVKLDINKKFTKKFPSISKIIKKLASDCKKEEKKLASIFQQAEADIFNGLIKDLKFKSKGIFTVYDSIYYTDYEDTKIIEEYIIDKFYRTPIKPRFNCLKNN